jgi:hypothetical protein
MKRRDLPTAEVIDDSHELEMHAIFLIELLLELEERDPSDTDWQHLVTRALDEEY